MYKSKAAKLLKAFGEQLKEDSGKGVALIGKGVFTIANRIVELSEQLNSFYSAIENKPIEGISELALIPFLENKTSRSEAPKAVTAKTTKLPKNPRLVTIENRLDYLNRLLLAKQSDPSMLIDTKEVEIEIKNLSAEQEALQSQVEQIQSQQKVEVEQKKELTDAVDNGEAIADEQDPEKVEIVEYLTQSAAQALLDAQEFYESSEASGVPINLAVKNIAEKVLQRYSFKEILVFGKYCENTPQAVGNPKNSQDFIDEVLKMIAQELTSAINEVTEPKSEEEQPIEATEQEDLTNPVATASNENADQSPDIELPLDAIETDTTKKKRKK